jgi:hypothetical protein
LIIESIRNDPDVRKEGIVFISGDVHFSQFLHSGCKSLATGYTLYEFTSSGMTHHTNEILGMGGYIVDIFTAKFWYHTDPVIDFNFGLATIKTNGSSIEANFKIIDIESVVRLNQTLIVNKDLTSNPDYLRYSQMCLTVHST